MLSSIFDRFVKKSPISVMAHGLMERTLNPDQLNQWFDSTAESQYTKDLPFSSIFDIMSNGDFVMLLPNNHSPRNFNMKSVTYTRGKDGI